MAIELTIRDGDPWYLSPDIWVVPGTDPNGPSGQPRVGETNFVWARVTNNGSTGVANATVKYYWANPATIITPVTANPIGISQVELAPGATKEVLCLSTWQPIWVNNGHECLIAEAFSPGDPVLHGAEEPFNPPGDRHVAQLNISVVQVTTTGKMAFPFFAFNPNQQKKSKFRLLVRQVKLNTLKPLINTLGLQSIPKKEVRVSDFGLDSYRCGDHLRKIGRPEFTLELAAGRHRGMAMMVNFPKNLTYETGALFLVEQYMGKQLLGGIAVLFIGSEAKKEKGGEKHG